MRVKDCKGSNCPHCVKCRNGNTINIAPSRPYSLCNLHGKRVSKVKNCSEYARLNGQISIFDEEVQSDVR